MLTVSCRKIRNPGWRSLLGGILAHYGDLDGLVVLNSGDYGFNGSRRCLIFTHPLAQITSSLESSRVANRSGVLEYYDGAWGALEQWLRPQLESLPSNIPAAAGYLSYELHHSLERVQIPKSSPYKIPAALMYLFGIVIEWQLEEPLTVWHLEHDQISKSFWDAPTIEEVLQTGDPYPVAGCESYDPEEFLRAAQRYSTVSKQRYLDNVNQIKELIRDGDVYQVNLTQRFKVPVLLSDAQKLFRALSDISSAQYGAYISAHCEEPFKVLSASPELFLKSDGVNLLSSPIKGTRIRSSNRGDDERLKLQLWESEKDRAELAMIVDLIRNDLGRIAEIGTVTIGEFPRLYSLPQVHHLVCDISARIDSRLTIFDGIKSLFPCGSISGAPKISALEIISRLENECRGVYTGAIGWLGGANSCGLNVAIRSGIIQGGNFNFHTGGGVVLDSDADSEYLESLVKARGIIEALHCCGLS